MQSATVEISDMVGERAYTLEESDDILFTVRFGRPFQDESGYYRCNFQFIGQHEDWSGSASGLDAIDALDSAFWMAGTNLTILNESVYQGKLRWDGAKEGKPIGLPVIPGDKHPFKDY